MPGSLRTSELVTGSEPRFPVDKEETEDERLVQSLLPWNYDDKKSKFLAMRASGFATREALNLCDSAKSTLSGWRKIPKFVEIENNLPELRQQIRMEYSSTMFFRNYVMVQNKDFQILERSLETDDIDIVDSHGKTRKRKIAAQLTKQENDYLLKLRTHYTPQQLEALNVLLAPDKADGNGGITWDDVCRVTEAAREGRLNIQARSRTVIEKEITITEEDPEE